MQVSILFCSFPCICIRRTSVHECPGGRTWLAESAPDVVLEVKEGTRGQRVGPRQKLGIRQRTTEKEIRINRKRYMNKDGWGFLNAFGFIAFIMRWYSSGNVVPQAVHISSSCVYLHTLAVAVGCIILNRHLIHFTFYFFIIHCLVTPCWHGKQDVFPSALSLLERKDLIGFGFTWPLSAGRGRSTSAFCIDTNMCFHLGLPCPYVSGTISTRAVTGPIS